MGLLQPLFTHSYVLRLTWGLGVFACLVPFTLLFSVLNWMDGMLHIWTIWTAAMGMTTLVHGERPPLDQPSVWVANHLCAPRRARRARSRRVRVATGSTGPCYRRPRAGRSACTQS